MNVNKARAAQKISRGIADIHRKEKDIRRRALHTLLFRLIRTVMKTIWKIMNKIM